MVKIKEKERAIIEFTCIPEVNIEKAEKLYDIGFKHLRELLDFSLDKDAKAKGLVEILNHRILSQFLSLEDEDIPSRTFKCPYCKGTVYADEEECSDCGALLLEEILEVEMNEVYNGLREMIDTVIQNPESALEYLEGFKEGEEQETAEEMELVTKEIGEQTLEERGFVVASIIPRGKGKNYLMVISPISGNEKERKKIFEDFKEFGAEEATNYSIEGGNINNKQEEAIRTVASKFVEEHDFKSLGIDKLFILNLKIAKFLESKATAMIEDNRHFLSSIEELSPDDSNIGAIKNMLYDSKLLKEIRKIGEKFVLDGVSFNNDPISFFMVKECIPILSENKDLDIRILDVVVNTNYVDQGNHNELVRLLQKWK
jgi:hypothetical protein